MAQERRQLLDLDWLKHDGKELRNPLHFTVPQNLNQAKRPNVARQDLVSSCSPPSCSHGVQDERLGT